MPSQIFKVLAQDVRGWLLVVCGIAVACIGAGVIGLGLFFAHMSITNGNDWRGTHGALAAVIQSLIPGLPLLIGGCLIVRRGRSTVGKK